jgi:hypothetical protein
MYLTIDASYKLEECMAQMLSTKVPHFCSLVYDIFMIS